MTFILLVRSSFFFFFPHEVQCNVHYRAKQNNRTKSQCQMLSNPKGPPYPLLHHYYQTNTKAYIGEVSTSPKAKLINTHQVHAKFWAPVNKIFLFYVGVVFIIYSLSLCFKQGQNQNFSTCSIKSCIYVKLFTLYA